VATAIAAQDDALHPSLLPLTVATQPGEPSATMLTQPSMPASPALSREYRALGVPAESATPAAVVATTTAEPTPEPPPPPVYIVYTVQEGDTVGGLAARFGIASSSILWNNPQLENGDSLALGEYLRIPMSDGIVYDVGPGDTLSDIADRFGVDVQTIITFPGNNLESADSIAENQTIFIPGGIMPAPVATPTSTPTPAPRPADPPAPAAVPLPPAHSPSGMRAQAVELARSRIGAPYVSGAAGPNAFDCSGLVFWVYSQLGLDVPRAAPDQFAWATAVGQPEMEPGDLVFFTNTYPSSQWITHVGIYTGGGMVLMAVDNGDIVREVSLAESYWSAHFAAASRPH